MPRSRFAPVKTTNDLLVVRSDAYTLTADYRLLPVYPPGNPPVIDLDKRYFRSIDDFEHRFPGGVPSLQACRQLKVVGDVKFGANVKLEGSVSLINNSGKQACIDQNSVIQGELIVSGEA